MVKLKIGDNVRIKFLKGKPYARVSHINIDGKVSVKYIGSNGTVKKTKHFSPSEFQKI